MGSMFSDTCSEVTSDGYMFGAVGYLQCNHWQCVVPYNNCTWWNVDSPLGSRHQTRVVTVEACHLSATREVPHSTSAGKVMATIFSDYKGVLLVELYIQQKTTVHDGPYYGKVLTNLRQPVKEKQRGMLTRGPLLLYDDAQAYLDTTQHCFFGPRLCFRACTMEFHFEMSVFKKKTYD